MILRFWRPKGTQPTGTGLREHKPFTHRFDQGCTEEAVAPPPAPCQHVVPWLTQGPSALDSALSLLPLLEAQMLTKRGSDLTVTAGPGRGKDTHSPVEATEELGAVRGEAE